mgnify:CR=1 FL=1
MQPLWGCRNDYGGNSNTRDPYRSRNRANCIRSGNHEYVDNNRELSGYGGRNARADRDGGVRYREPYPYPGGSLYPYSRSPPGPASRREIDEARARRNSDSDDERDSNDRRGTTMALMRAPPVPAADVSLLMTAPDVPDAVVPPGMRPGSGLPSRGTLTSSGDAARVYTSANNPIFRQRLERLCRRHPRRCIKPTPVVESPPVLTDASGIAPPVPEPPRTVTSASFVPALDTAGNRAAADARAGLAPRLAAAPSGIHRSGHGESDTTAVPPPATETGGTAVQPTITTLVVRDHAPASTAVFDPTGRAKPDVVSSVMERTELSPCTPSDRSVASSRASGNGAPTLIFFDSAEGGEREIPRRRDYSDYRRERCGGRGRVCDRNKPNERDIGSPGVALPAVDSRDTSNRNSYNAYGARASAVGSVNMMSNCEVARDRSNANCVRAAGVAAANSDAGSRRYSRSRRFTTLRYHPIHDGIGPVGRITGENRAIYGGHIRANHGDAEPEKNKDRTAGSTYINRAEIDDVFTELAARAPVTINADCPDTAAVTDTGDNGGANAGACKRRGRKHERARRNRRVRTRNTWREVKETDEDAVVTALSDLLAASPLPPGLGIARPSTETSTGPRASPVTDAEAESRCPRVGDGPRLTVAGPARDSASAIARFRRRLGAWGRNHSWSTEIPPREFAASPLAGNAANAHTPAESGAVRDSAVTASRSARRTESRNSNIPVITIPARRRGYATMTADNAAHAVRYSAVRGSDDMAAAAPSTASSSASMTNIDGAAATAAASARSRDSPSRRPWAEARRNAREHRGERARRRRSPTVDGAPDAVAADGHRVNLMHGCCTFECAEICSPDAEGYNPDLCHRMVRECDAATLYDDSANVALTPADYAAAAAAPAAAGA